MNKSNPHSVVIGAGVIGLTTAQTFLDEGWDVTIVAGKVFPEPLTSLVAGAVVFPEMDLGLESTDTFSNWRYSHAWYVERTKEEFAGLRFVSGTRFYRSLQAIPAWADDVNGVARVDAVPHNAVDGLVISRTPMVDMRTYLPALFDTVMSRGVQLQHRLVNSLSLDIACDVVVNCSGLGAAGLAEDPTVIAVRGQVIIMDNPGISDFVSIEPETERDDVCVYPHSDTCLLGGTFEFGVTDMEPNSEDTARIFRDCRELEPLVGNPSNYDVLIGLRPWRQGGPRIELDQDRSNNRTAVIHNYGHGGSGVTFAPSSSRSVVDLANNYLRDRAHYS